MSPFGNLGRPSDYTARAYSGTVKVAPAARVLHGQSLPRDADGALVASGCVLALMTVIAVGSLWFQPDHPLWCKLAGSLVSIAVAAGFEVVQVRLVHGVETGVLRAVSVLVIGLAIGNVYVSDAWSLLGVGAAAAMLIVPRFGLVAGLAALIAGSAPALSGHISVAGKVAIPLISLVVAVGLHTLTRLAQVLVELRLSQEELARMQVDRERSRISRDLHDIIGRTLVATSLRVQSAVHLIDLDLERTKQQLEHAQQALAAGQAELRAMTRGPITTSLADELRSAQALCERLRIALSLDVAHDLEDPNETAARIVREGVTNMLKHSRPSACRIRIRTVPALDVTIVNDGCPGAPMNENGSGLADLRRHLAPAGLVLSAGLEGPGEFALRVRPRSDPQEG